MEDAYYTGQIIPLSYLEKLPEGLLWCDGQVLKAQQYQALFSVIGNQFGGTFPNFALPDLRQRFPMGTASAGKKANTPGYPPSLGDVQGAAQVMLEAAHLPLHTHTAIVEGTVSQGGIKIRVDDLQNPTSLMGAADDLVLTRGTISDTSPRSMNTFFKNGVKDGNLGGVTGGTGQISKFKITGLPQTTSKHGKELTRQEAVTDADGKPLKDENDQVKTQTVPDRQPVPVLPPFLAFRFAIVFEGEFPVKSPDQPNEPHN